MTSNELYRLICEIEPNKRRKGPTWDSQWCTSRIGGGIGAAPDGYEGHVTFYVEVPDVEAALQKAESLGGERRYGPDEVPGAGITIGQFADPEGRVIGLMSSA
jgi:predicted enzyme related to lactoylglutathione lyase